MVARIGAGLLARHITLSVAESCTGGLIGHLLTNMPGSSEWFLGGVVAYANSLKTNVLNVGLPLIEGEGAVSEGCVRAMVRGVCGLTGSECGIAVSGIAGPGGGSPAKPVGTVWIAWAVRGEVWAAGHLFAGGREEIKEAAAVAALEGLIVGLDRNAPIR
jgi:nicotinamide-nucleotide amidase